MHSDLRLIRRCIFLPSAKMNPQKMLKVPQHRQQQVGSVCRQQQHDVCMHAPHAYSAIASWLKVTILCCPASTNQAKMWLRLQVGKGDQCYNSPCPCPAEWAWHPPGLPLTWGDLELLCQLQWAWRLLSPWAAASHPLWQQPATWYLPHHQLLGTTRVLEWAWARRSSGALPPGRTSSTTPPATRLPPQSASMEESAVWLACVASILGFWGWFLGALCSD